MRNPTLTLTHPEVTREGLLAFARKTPGAAIGIKVAALLLVLEGQRPKWIIDILGLTRQSLNNWMHNVNERGIAALKALPRPVWLTLRHLPSAFSLEHYLDDRGHLALLIAKGRVSFVRKVDAHGCIEFNGAEYFIFRRLERQYVVATLSTYHRRVFVKFENKVIKTFPFPFVGKAIDPIA